MAKLLIFLLALMGAALPGRAQSISQCNWVASAANLVEPWGDNSRTFANGAVKIALLDTFEPACCSFHLLVLSPDPEISRACHVVSVSPGTGWGNIHFMKQKASYDPALGLRVNVLVDKYDAQTGVINPALRQTLGVRINQATGLVTLE